MNTTGGKTSRAFGIMVCLAALFLLPALVRAGDGDAFTEPLTGMEFVKVKGGCYMMGCGPWTDNCAGDELPTHQVCLQDFWMAKYEVTQEQWKTVMGNNPSAMKPDGRRPVESVSWTEATAFARALSAKSPSRATFALPDEEQWEYACRSGGLPEKYAGGQDISALGWWLGNSNGTTQAVGGKKPNGLGLYDMSGNVWEWCADDYDANAYAKDWGLNEPTIVGPDPKSRRGGSWDYDSMCPRCSNRKAAPAEARESDIGLRLIMLPPTP